MEEEKEITGVVREAFGTLSYSAMQAEPEGTGAVDRAAAGAAAVVLVVDLAVADLAVAEPVGVGELVVVGCRLWVFGS